MIDIRVYILSRLLMKVQLMKVVRKKKLTVLGGIGSCKKGNFNILIFFALLLFCMLKLISVTITWGGKVE